MGERFGHSPLQAFILDFLLRATEAQEKADLPEFVTCWGVPWRTDRLSRAQQAAMSRALRRLEGGGFVLRQNCVTGGDQGTVRRSKSERHHRTTHVQLLRKGRELAVNIRKGG